MPTVRDTSGTVAVVAGSETVTLLPYSTSISMNASQGRYFQIVAADGVGFTINAPSSPVIGSTITFDIKNSSGGALGTITWNAVFKMPAFAGPGNGLRSIVSFYYDGTNWVTLGPQSVAA